MSAADVGAPVVTRFQQLSALRLIGLAVTAVARIVTYGAVCAALPVLRRKNPQQQTFRLAAGPILAGLGLAFAGILATGMTRTELFILLATAVVATVNWLSVRHRLNPVAATVT